MQLEQARTRLHNTDAEHNSKVWAKGTSPARLARPACGLLPSSARALTLAIITTANAQVEALQQQLNQQLEEVAAQLEEAKKAAAHSQAAQEAAHAAALQEVDQWCVGEVEAVRHVASAQAAALQDEVKRW